MNKRTVLLSFLLFTLTSCVEQIDLFSGDASLLVVDGTLTNAEGAQTIRISFSSQFQGFSDYSLVNEAKVTIIDDLGKVELLQYTDRGVFKTSDVFKAEIGRSYKLTIVLASGATYESDYEEMLDVSPIDHIEHEITQDSIHFFIDFNDQENVENYYRWRYEGTYEVFAPETKNTLVTTGGCRIRPDKLAANCWAKDYDIGYLNISNDRVFDGTGIEHFKIYSLPKEDIRFAIGYSAQISQYSLSKEAMIFWRAISDELDNAGSIFDASKYRIVGNVKNINNEKEAVLGYFGVSAKSSQRIFIDNEELDFEFIYSCEPSERTGCIRIQCYDCRSHSGSSDVTIPDFWP